MRAEFVCPVCKETIFAPESLAGESAPCPRCRADIDRWPNPISAPSATSPSTPTAPPPPLPTEIHIEHRDATSRTGHGRSAFRTTFGGSLGCFFAIVLVCGGAWLYFKLPSLSDRHIAEYVAMGLPANPADWTNRELHKFLVKKGVSCELVGSGGYQGVLFCTAEISASSAEAMHSFRTLAPGMFYVKRHSSPDDARREVESESERNQNIHHWGVFSFYGAVGSIAHLKNALP